MYFSALVGDYSDVGKLVALCDVNASRMAYYNELWSQEQPDAKPLPTYHADQFGELLDKERPEVVVVTTVDATHHRYITAALRAGCDVVVEKPLTTDAEKARQVVEAVQASGRSLVATFNYRYSPRNFMAKKLISEGAIGEVTSVHFEWVLDTIHGADYFRRWHRDKQNSGGLLVHKASHHFDLVNWWIAAVPETVYAQGDLRFYGADNAKARGLGERPTRSYGSDGIGSDPFALDITANPRTKRLYLDAEKDDGYIRDRDVFSEGISIEDNMSVLVRYTNRALLTYSLNAHSPWEGYRVAFNGTAGRLELEVIERPWAQPPTGSTAGDARSAVDPSVAEAEGAEPVEEVRKRGTKLVLQQHWQPAQLIEVPEGKGGHGGGDVRLLDDVFRGASEDPLGRPAGYLDGLRSVGIGIAANQSLLSGTQVNIADLLGVKLS